MQIKASDVQTYLTSLASISKGHPCSDLAIFIRAFPDSATATITLMMAFEAQLHPFQLLRSLDSYIMSHVDGDFGLVHPSDREKFYG